MKVRSASSERGKTAQLNPSPSALSTDLAHDRFVSEQDND